MRFSLKILLLLPVLVSIPMLCLASRVHQQRRQMAAVRALDASGALITTQSCWDGLSHAFAKRVLGNDFFECPCIAVFFSETFGAMEQRHLRSLVDLELLVFDGCQTTSETFVSVGQLQNLKGLSLHDTPTDDAQLAPLLALRNLELLDLSQTRVTDAAIECLVQLRSLRWLYVGQTSITAQGRKDLQAALPSCDIRLQALDGVMQ